MHYIIVEINCVHYEWNIWYFKRLTIKSLQVSYYQKFINYNFWPLMLGYRKSEISPTIEPPSPLYPNNSQRILILRWSLNFKPETLWQVKLRAMVLSWPPRPVDLLLSLHFYNQYMIEWFVTKFQFWCFLKGTKNY